MYEVNGWLKFGGRTYYETGCDPNECVHFGGNESWSAETVPELLNKLRGFVCVDDDYGIELDACDEDGRVDIQVLEIAEGYTASERDIELWKWGQRALWACTYTFMVEQVERKSVRLVEV